MPPYPLDELRRTPGPPRPKDAPEGSPRGLRPIPARPRLKNRLEVGARQVTTHGHDGEGYLGSVAVEKATQGLEEAEACDRGGMRGAEGRGAASDGEQAEGIWRGSAGSLLRNG